MTPEEMRKSCAEYVELSNSHDVDEIMKRRPEDAYLHIKGVADPIAGHEAVREFYTRFYGEVVPDFTFHIEDFAFGDDVTVMWGHFTGTVGENVLGAQAKAGSKIDVPCVFVVTFKDGWYHGDNMYFDSLLMRQQAGIDEGAAADPHVLLDETAAPA
jgi:ketosteroid isomerase-like protein